MQWFGVALWYGDFSPFPEWIDTVQSSSAFAAIDLVMFLAGRGYVARATAIALNGSLRYRAFRVYAG
jgi:hypothetical protein